MSAVQFLFVVVPQWLYATFTAKAYPQFWPILENRQEPRVGTSQPPMVVGEATALIDATSPRVIRATPQVHQRQTRRNTPMPMIMEGDEITHADSDIITKGINTLCNSRAVPPSLPTRNPTILNKERRNHWEQAQSLQTCLQEAYPESHQPTSRKG